MQPEKLKKIVLNINILTIFVVELKYFMTFCYAVYLYTIT